MAATVTGALKDRFDASAAYADVASSGGLWVGEVPENSVMPFVVLLHGGAEVELHSEGNYLESARYEFRVYAVGLAVAESIATKIRQTFDTLASTSVFAAAVVIDNVHPVRCWRTGYSLEAVSDRDKDGNQVYSVTLPYQVVTRHIAGIS